MVVNMISFNSTKTALALVLTGFALSFLGCSQQSSDSLSGIWRSDDALAAKNLVIEFVPDGTGSVFSGSIIGFPADASFSWERKGNQVQIETVGDEPVEQTMTIVSQDALALNVEVNRTEFTLVRVDDIMDEDALDSLP